jgi:hypothetical protein
LRFSRKLRQQNAPDEPGSVPLRRILFWVVVGAVLVTGFVLYFKYERLLEPLLG